MAQIVFSPRERQRIAHVTTELDATARGFFDDARAHLSKEEWRLLMEYAGACVRRALEVGSLLHAVVKETDPPTPYPGRGRSAFVKAALEHWRDCFAPIPDVWRLAGLCQKVPGGEQRVKAEITVLEVMAADRMFGAFDEEYAAFFRPAR